MGDATSKPVTPDPALLEPPRAHLPEGKDELNLAEFPLCCIADRTQPDQKTLMFEDRVWDASRGEMITRQLTITGSDRFGLPTALDDEVLLGLIQLTKLHEFNDRRVSFTRYHLLRLLGWRDDSKSYERLETSLNRWVGVTLYYSNAWWSREQQSWVDEKFHVLDNVTLFDRDKARRHLLSHRQATLPLSQFTWNDILFRSFKAGNLKGLDFDFFKGLQSAIAKRLYRFLDKRFFHRKRWEFNLKELAWEHVGLARSYDTANLKRKLWPAIVELEQQGFLIPLPESERFRKVSCGEWRVLFEQASPEVPQVTAQRTPDPAETALQEALTQRGVTPSTARRTVTAYPHDQIRTQLEVFDWLMAHADARVSRNPPGFLISSIQSQYAPPRDFISLAEQNRRVQKATERQQRKAERQQALAQQAHERDQARVREIQRFWDSLSQDERTRLEQEALAQASPFQRRLLDQGGSLGPAAQKAILDAYALNLLKAGS